MAQRILEHPRDESGFSGGQRSTDADIGNTRAGGSPGSATGVTHAKQMRTREESRAMAGTGSCQVQAW